MSEVIFETPKMIPGHAGPTQRNSLVMPNKARKMQIPKNFNHIRRRLKETGTLAVEDFRNPADIGTFIDYLNHLREKEIEKEAQKEITAMNEYYAPLWKRAIEEYDTVAGRNYRKKNILEKKMKLEQQIKREHAQRPKFVV